MYQEYNSIMVITQERMKAIDSPTTSKLTNTSVVEFIQNGFLKWKL